MKALKEKRISLRSLWRRGLVILSLFALVFASCNNTDEPGSSSSGSGGRVPLEIRVKTHPKNASYEGMPVDTTGIQIEARYSDAPYDWKDVTDISNYAVAPKYTQKNPNDAAGGAMNNFYRVYTVVNGTTLSAPINVTVRNLLRSNSKSQGTPDGVGTPNYGTQTNNDPQNDNQNRDGNDTWAQGLQIYAPPGYTDKYYVDDFPDFTGIHLQGHYSDGKLLEIYPEP